jgi:hypothetical protein
MITKRYSRHVLLKSIIRRYVTDTGSTFTGYRTVGKVVMIA